MFSYSLILSIKTVIMATDIETCCIEVYLHGGCSAQAGYIFPQDGALS